ncbi:hypothetical protein OIU79_020135 [Salix purpurea]|uniref:Uncharacterized protein n=1 Tax=Salix purpurea TaxID=77065 RepID=A0A9Q0SJZ0_SALPP|nr:hypothetical protein OIU79_020135 [Salix purpurea]
MPSFISISGPGSFVHSRDAICNTQASEKKFGTKHSISEMQETSPATFPKSIPSIFSANFTLQKVCLNGIRFPIPTYDSHIFPSMHEMHKIHDISMHVISTNTYISNNLYSIKSFCVLI